LVVFDISEKEKWLRNWLRRELLLMQFKPLQKSVYIGKYPIPDDLYQEIIKNKLFENVYVFTIEKVDKEDQILKFLNE
jgi:DNA-binding transcriptional regulator PaaX